MAPASIRVFHTNSDHGNTEDFLRKESSREAALPQSESRSNTEPVMLRDHAASDLPGRVQRGKMKGRLIDPCLFPHWLNNLA